MDETDLISAIAAPTIGPGGATVTLLTSSLFPSEDGVAS